MFLRNCSTLCSPWGTNLILYIRETNFNIRSTNFLILYSDARQSDIWEDNIKIDIDEIVEKGVDWIEVAKDGEKLRDFVKTVLNFRFP